MRLPAKVEYACMAVLELSLRYVGNVPVQLIDDLHYRVRFGF